MENLIGFVEFKSGIPVRGDTLGEIYQAKFGEQDVSIHFPCLPEKPHDYTIQELLPPKGCEIRLSGSWGQLRSHNSIQYKADTCIAVVSQVYIVCQTEDPDNASDDIFHNIDKWRDSLKAVICLENKIVVDNLWVSSITTERGSIVLCRTRPKVKAYDNRSVINISSSVITLEDILTKEKLLTIFRLTDCKNKLKLEYELLLQAYIERAKGNYRYSLIQALSAIEVCVDVKINYLCDEKEIDTNRLIGRKSLGEKFEILKAFGVNWLTKNPNEEIVKHRNDLFHMRVLSPSLQRLNDVISAVEMYLREYSKTYYDEELLQ